jgi:hypothetical protein
MAANGKKIENSRLIWNFEILSHGRYIARTLEPDLIFLSKIKFGVATKLFRV